jgi:hypothetical protein
MHVLEAELDAMMVTPSVENWKYIELEAASIMHLSMVLHLVSSCNVTVMCGLAS